MPRLRPHGANPYSHVLQPLSLQAVSIKRFLCRHSLTLTAALVTFLSLCRLADVAPACLGGYCAGDLCVHRCVHSSMVILAEAEDFERAWERRFEMNEACFFNGEWGSYD